VSTATYDVIAAEVHRKALENLTNEMAIALLRTSGSPVVVDAKDFSTCFMDTTPEHLGFAAYVLFHLGTSLVGTTMISEMVSGSGDLRPGDGWIVNDPHEGGAAHQGDVAVIMPMFHDNEHLGWGFVNMHILDVGGAGLSGIAPGAHDVYAEGLRFPAIRAIRDGAIEPEWEHFITANVRAPGPVLNDLRSMIAANNVGNRKLSELVDGFGRARYEEFCAINKDLTENVLRERIARIPDGVYEAVEWNEFDGHDGPDQLLELRLRLEVDGSDLRFHYSGAPQIDGFVNAGKGSMWGQTITAVLTTLAYGDLPVNGGLWRPIEIDLGEPGTIVNSLAPAPVSDGHAEVGMRACKLTKDVLSQAVALSDDPVLRGRAGANAHDGTPVNALFGGNQHGGQSVIIYLDSPVGIGGGAQSVVDGQDAYGCTCMTGCGLSDLESHEAADPVLFLWRKVVPNSGGPGRYRGGQGLEQAFSMAYVDQMGGPSWNSCAEVPPSGFGGGLPGAGSTYHVIRASNVPALLEGGELPLPDRLDGRTELLRNKVGHLTLGRDDVLVMVSGGGGGLGDPLLRPASTVADDVRAGYVTAQHADAAYGVVLGDDGEADPEATAARRLEIRRLRIDGEPTKDLAEPESAGVSVLRDDSGWSCASCGTRLAAADENWRTGAVLREAGIVERFAELHMYVRDRREDPKVMLREHHCPACAAALGSDVATEGTEMLPAPRAA
jgi:N-methylhydantoinase B